MNTTGTTKFAKPHTNIARGADRAPDCSDCADRDHPRAHRNCPKFGYVHSENGVRACDACEWISGEVVAGGIRTHAGNKYLRTAHSPVDGQAIQIDVYAVLEAFGVACPGRQQAIKKLLCAGLRGKGSQLQDLIETQAAVSRAIELQKIREETAK